MKILYIHHYPGMEGSAISLFIELDGLKRKGVELALVLPKIPFSPDFLEKLESLKIPFFVTDIVQSVVDENKYRAMTICQRIRFLRVLYKKKIVSYFALSRIVKLVKPDIIHTNVGVVHEGFWVSRRYSIPHVFHLREYQDSDFGLKILPSKRRFQSILKKSEVITITDDIRRHFGLEEYGHAHRIYNGVILQQKNRLLLPKERFFFCASRIIPEKGLDCAIVAFGSFFQSHNGFQLIIAGRGPEDYIDDLNSLAEKSGCGNAVKFIGQIDLNEVYNYMSKATALLVCSWYEGLGRMTIEAAFAGCLVIGRNTAGTKEVLEKTGGFVFDDNVEIPALMVEVAALSSAEYENKALKAQSLAEEFFSAKVSIDKVYGLYCTLLGGVNA